MALPFDLETAKKLHKKNQLTDHQLAHFERMCHGGEAGYADGGEVETDIGVDVPISMADAKQLRKNEKISEKQYSRFERMYDGGEVSSPDGGEAADTADETAPAAPQEEVNPYFAMGQNAVTPTPAPVPLAQTQPLPQQTGFWNPGVNEGVKPITPPLATEMPTPNQPQQEVTPEMISPMDAGYKLQEKGVKEATDAGKQKAAFEYGKLKEQAAQDAQMIQANQEQEQAHAQFAQENMDKLNKQLDQISAQKVDPNRIFANRSTGDKILGAIGFFLGALGPGQENTYTKAVNEAVDRDIKLQESERMNQMNSINQKKSVYSDMYNIYRNQDAAREATRIAMNNNVIMQVNANSAKYGGIEAQSKGDILTGQLMNQNEQSRLQLLSAMAKQQPLTPAQINDPSLIQDPEKAKRVVPHYGIATSEKAAGELTTMIGEGNEAITSLNDLRAIANKTGSSVNPIDAQRASSIAAMLKGKLKKQILGPGVYTEVEQGIMSDIVADPTKLWSLSISNKAALDTLEKKILDGRNAQLRANGLPTDQDMKKQRSASLGFTPGK